MRVWDADSNEYLDLVAGIATNVLGHAHPAVVRAIQEQATQLIHVSNLYINERQVELAEQLYNVSGGMRSFFSNSGAEANEGAIKLARKYGRVNRGGAYGIISMRALVPRAHAGDDSAPPARRSIRIPGSRCLMASSRCRSTTSTPSRRRLHDKTAGVLIEAVQGEGGIYPATTEYMRACAQWCDEQNLMLICDEVQAGMGRTGKFFSWEHYGIRPDITTMAKGLAGGVPIGAMLADPRADIFEPGDHGTTFGGNPIACAAGVATVSTIFGEHLLEHATEMGEYLEGKIEELRRSTIIITGPARPRPDARLRLVRAACAGYHGSRSGARPADHERRALDDSLRPAADHPAGARSTRRWRGSTHRWRRSSIRQGRSEGESDVRRYTITWFARDGWRGTG